MRLLLDIDELRCDQVGLTHRRLSIFIYVEVPADPRADAGRDRRVLLAVDPGAAQRRGRGAGRAPAQGARGPRTAPADVAGGLARGRRGVRVRPQRRLRPLAADDQPPPQGPARGGAARPHQARGLGLLRRQGRSARRPRRADRRSREVSLVRRAAAELIGTAFLVTAVVGSGIAASRLSPGDIGLQLLENSLITGAALVALILALQPVSAAFNPVVTLVEVVLGKLAKQDAVPLILAQFAGGFVGVIVANLMFGLDAVTISTHHRTGGGLWLGEVVATLGLLLVIFGSVRSGRTETIAYAVGGYITAAYWFTSSTSFANPAVTLARMLSDTFAGIAPSSVAMFVLMQLIGGALAVGVVTLLYPLDTIRLLDPEQVPTGEGTRP